jgi:hypothetical protein
MIVCSTSSIGLLVLAAIRVVPNRQVVGTEACSVEDSVNVFLVEGIDDVVLPLEALHLVGIVPTVH